MWRGAACSATSTTAVITAHGNSFRYGRFGASPFRKGIICTGDRLRTIAFPPDARRPAAFRAGGVPHASVPDRLLRLCFPDRGYGDGRIGCGTGGHPGRSEAAVATGHGPRRQRGALRRDDHD